MPQPRFAPSPDPVDRAYAVTHPLRPMLTAGILSLALFTLSVGLSCVAVWPQPPRFAPLLVALTAVFVTVWAVGLVAMVVRRPGHAERVRIWSRVAVAVIIGSHLACFGLIWGIMPFVAAPTQLLLALPLLGCVPVQLICSPESSVANRSGAVGVTGSLALFFLTRGTPVATCAGLYVLGFAAVMLILGDRVAAIVRATVAARLASDRAAEKLDRLLAQVAAERDAKTKFIAAASHDLGQPLAAAALFFDQSLRTSDDLARAKAIDGVRRAFASAEQLLSHMLGHLRLEADAVEPHPSPLAVGPLLARVAAQYAPAAGAAGIALRPLASALTLRLDPTLIERALGNLVDNAIRHGRARRVVLGARRKGDRVQLWVVDDGVGVAPIDARHIFDDYYQAEQGNVVRSGFGLGLASVRRIAALMNGVADLDRRWLGGAAFYLDFPATTARARRDELAA